MNTADLLKKLKTKRPDPLRGHSREYRPTLNALRENEHPHPETTMGAAIHKQRLERIRKETRQ